MAGILPSLLLCAASVHPDTINDVARVESGFNPFAIAEIIPKKERDESGKSVITHMPSSKEDALSIIHSIENKNRRYSVGLMQITSTNFSLFGTSAERLLSPCENLSVFEKILVDCYQRGGDLENALSCYYSGNFSTGKKKESEFSNSSYVERIGYKQNPANYIVPSTKNDKGESGKGNTHIKTISVIYPESILKSAFVDNEKPTKIIN
ncbi:lytic transglycosylase domain-containing protein [Salmonella enterica]|nr:lytic transglycosylase domain-containing protein [Salmonella enterica]